MLESRLRLPAKGPFSLRMHSSVACADLKEHVLFFVGYAFVGLKKFSFRRVIDGVTPVETAVAAAPKATFDERCCAIANQHGLTPRELEVFQMLARGRDRTYIQEQLVVSLNTVKAHVKHIYAKLDIHSHQDLIDLVEKG